MTWDYCKPAGFKCTYSLEIKSKNSCLYIPPPNVIHGITTPPSLIMSTFTIKCIFTAISHLITHPMVNSLHVGLTMTPTSRSGIHRLAISFPTFMVNKIALSSSLINHSLGKKLISLKFKYENIICVFDTYTVRGRFQH